MSLSKEIKSLVVSDAQRAADLTMVPYDIWGTKVHVLMLARQNIISGAHATKILAALADIEMAWRNNQFSIDPELGAQLTLEKEVIKRAGEEAGLSMHTARSRNDQIMTTELLYLRAEILNIQFQITQLMQVCINRATEYISVPMPGYTHMQPGKPTAASHWFLSHAESLRRGYEALTTVLDRFDRSPLGAVEAYGTSWPIDRLFSANLLGFSRVWEIPQDAISNRGMFQLAFLGASTELGVAISRIASDIMLFSTYEFRLISFGDDVAQRLHPMTGSSVMAQKKNPDAAELLRATAPQMAGLYQAVAGVLSALPSGYNRDSREVKEYMQLGVVKLKQALASLDRVLGSLQFNKKRMLQFVVENYSQTTDLADYVSAKSNIPYRKVYKIVGQVVDGLMELEKPLTTISASMIIAKAKELGEKLTLSDDDIRLALDAVEGLERRVHVGGTNRGVTENILERFRTHARREGEKIADKLQAIENKKIDLDTHIHSLSLQN